MFAAHEAGRVCIPSVERMRGLEFAAEDGRVVWPPEEGDVEGETSRLGQMVGQPDDKRKGASRHSLSPNL